MDLKCNDRPIAARLLVLMVLSVKLLKTLLLEITSIPQLLQNTVNRVLKMVNARLARVLFLEGRIETFGDEVKEFDR